MGAPVDQTDIASLLCEEARGLFPAEDIRVDVFRPDTGESTAQVRLTHIPSGLQEIGDKWESQRANLALACIRLRKALDAQSR